MKEALLLVLVPIFCSAALFQSPPCSAHETSIQRTNIVMRWNAPKHPWPKTLWVYQVVPTKLSPAVLSNLMAIGSFTDKDEQPPYGRDWRLFANSGRILNFSRAGEIRYTTPDKGRALGKNVPGTNQLFQLTATFLQKLGISLSEIAKGDNGKTSIHYLNDIGGSWHEDHVLINNITGREVGFTRGIDGIICLGWDTGGHGRIVVGENGRVEQIMLHWSSLERDTLYSSATPASITKFIGEGKGTLHRVVGGADTQELIDLATVKTLTIKTAKPFYLGENYYGERAQRPFFPSWIRPFATLQGTVDTGTTNTAFWMDCPIIDESKPLEAKDSVPHPK